MNRRIHIAIGTFLTILCLAQSGAAEGKYFNNRLTLPDFPGFDVFVQKVDDKKAKKMKEKRWDLSAKPNSQSTTHYLLVAPEKNLWITISLLHTQYGGKVPLDAKKFESEFVKRIAGTQAVLENKSTLKSQHAGTLGFFYLTDKSKTYATRLLYVPAAKHGNYGDKRAFLIGITYNASATEEAKALLKKIVNNVKVSKKS